MHAKYFLSTSKLLAEALGRCRAACNITSRQREHTLPNLARVTHVLGREYTTQSQIRPEGQTACGLQQQRRTVFRDRCSGPASRTGSCFETADLTRCTTSTGSAGRADAAAATHDAIKIALPGLVQCSTPTSRRRRSFTYTLSSALVVVAPFSITDRTAS